jgi:hypothetical protein
MQCKEWILVRSRRQRVRGKAPNRTAVEFLLFLVFFFNLAFCPCISELLLQRRDLRLQGGVLQDKIPDLRSDELRRALLRLLRCGDCGE